MARKTLLNESEIRKFLKLANITTVGEDKIQEMGMGMSRAYDRDDDMEAPMDGDDDMEEPMGDVDDDDMMGPDEPMGGDMDMGAMDQGDREELMADVVRAVAQALGIEDQVSVEAGEDDGMEGGEMDAMPEPAPVADKPAEPEMDMKDDEEVDMMAEESDDTDVVAEETDEDVVSEVARRVMDRIQNETNKEKMVDALAERIMKRLTK